MPVKVHKVQGNEVVSHDRGQYISTQSDGHLNVHRVTDTNELETLAIYAPGQWLTAEVEDA